MLAMLAAAASSNAPIRRSTMDRFPRMFVWAWERPEDLRDLDREIGVAFLAQTISITGDGFTLRRAVNRCGFLQRRRSSR